MAVTETARSGSGGGDAFGRRRPTPNAPAAHPQSSGARRNNVAAPLPASPARDANRRAAAERAGHTRASRRAKAAASTIGISSRVVRVCACFGLAYLALGARLCHLQVVRHDEFVREAEKMRTKAIPLLAQRGVILDRNGILLAHNQPSADIIVDPNMWLPNQNPKAGDTFETRKNAALSGLTALLKNVPGVDVAGTFAARGLVRGKSGRYRTIEIAQRIPATIGESVQDNVRKAKITGVGVLPSSRRFALNGNLAAHILGFTGKGGEGLSGLEGYLDSSLAGKQGLLKGQFDAKNRLIPGTVSADRPASHGRDVLLTLDSEIQSATEKALIKGFEKARAQSAVAVVLDSKTGEIIASASLPTYNVNRREASPPEARANRVVESVFEPGSTLKVMTIAAALEEKKVTPSTYFYCTGAHTIGRKTIHCASHGGHSGHGDESLVDVIVNSCNVATAQCASYLGKDKLYEYETRFGFGKRTGAGLPGESPGILSPSSSWSDIQLANVAFGQGISVTPLQLAAAYGAIASDGIYHAPHIVWGYRDSETKTNRPAIIPEGRPVVSSETARAMRQMLQQVVERGTGKLAQLDGYTAGGKTGTAQIAEHGHYGSKFVASFVGMAPMSKPEFVILVAVTAPQGQHYGGEVAAPIFKEIAEKALRVRRIPRDKVSASGTGHRRGADSLRDE